MSSPRPVRPPSPWREAEQAFRELRGAVDRGMEEALAACDEGKLPSAAGAQIDGLSRQAAVLLAAAYESFRSPPSGARLQVLRSELGGDLGWRVAVRIVWSGP